MALGILGLCGAAPRLLIGALGGVLVDRYDRKRLLILIQFFSVLPVLLFLILYTARCRSSFRFDPRRQSLRVPVDPGGVGSARTFDERGFSLHDRL